MKQNEQLRFTHFRSTLATRAAFIACAIASLALLNGCATNDSQSSGHGGEEDRFGGIL